MRNLVENLYGSWNTSLRWEENIQTHIRQKVCERKNCIQPAHDRVRWHFYACEYSRFLKEFKS